MPVLLAQITDLHLAAGPGDAGAAHALERAVRALLDLDPQPDAVLLTGDLTDDGDPRSYARVRELLAPLTVPVHPIPGNHDDRDALRAAFLDHPGVAGADGFVQYAITCGPLRVLMLDTLVPGTPGGRRGSGGGAPPVQPGKYTATLVKLTGGEPVTLGEPQSFEVLSPDRPNGTAEP